VTSCDQLFRPSPEDSNRSLLVARGQEALAGADVGGVDDQVVFLEAGVVPRAG